MSPACATPWDSFLKFLDETRGSSFDLMLQAVEVAFCISINGAIIDLLTGLAPFSYPSSRINAPHHRREQ
jgi:hypothetical protein